MQRFAGLRGERYFHASMNLAFVTENSPFAELFNDSVGLALVAYLGDVFEQSNALNLSVQGSGHNIFEQSEKNRGAQKEDRIVGESCFQK